MTDAVDPESLTVIQWSPIDWSVYYKGAPLAEAQTRESALSKASETLQRLYVESLSLLHEGD